MSAEWPRVLFWQGGGDQEPVEVTTPGNIILHYERAPYAEFNDWIRLELVVSYWDERLDELTQRTEADDLRCGLCFGDQALGSFAIVRAADPWPTTVPSARRLIGYRRAVPDEPMSRQAPANGESS